VIASSNQQAIPMDYFYHVRIGRKSNPSYEEVKLDLTLDELNKRFVLPYREGQPITTGGTVIEPEDIARIRIGRSKETAAELRNLVKMDRARKGPSLVPEDWLIAQKAEDVTDEFITTPPKITAPAKIVGTGASMAAAVEDKRTVFVVHGRDEDIRASLFNFLRSIGLTPLEWTQAVLETGKGTPYIGEILDRAFALAQAVVVLLTPDDEGRLRAAFQVPSDPSYEFELTGQARQNVLFEAGMAFGRFPDRTILVEVGTTKPFSDIGGRHVVRLDNSISRRQDLARRLKAAGCSVDLTGTEWHNVGTFE
jgi:predicted nucleotide-binding protein